MRGRLETGIDARLRHGELAPLESNDPRSWLDRHDHDLRAIGQSLGQRIAVGHVEDSDAGADQVGDLTDNHRATIAAPDGYRLGMGFLTPF
ncbi:MAG: hypothetical protein IT581_04800 [Verrucomicrobiales bacterium]|nr:hypothetical protein [Verrucomicrobiales bacterium]